MNAARDLGPEFRTWLADAPPMPADLPARTLKLTRDTQQRRRWLWFLPGPKPTAGANEPTDPIEPLAYEPVTGRLSSARIGGIATMFTPAMFSATRLFAAVAILALAGGIISSGVLTTEPETTEGSPAWTSQWLEGSDFVAVTGSARFGAGPGYLTGSSTMSDPRVSGDWEVRYEWLCGPNEACTTWGRAILTNDDGTWEGDYVGLNGPLPNHDQNVMVWLNGTGDYEGWSYAVNFVGPMSDSAATGHLVAAPLPPQVALSFSEAPSE